MILGLIILSCVALVLIFVSKRKTQKIVAVSERLTLDTLTKYVMHKIIDMLKQTDRSGLSEEKYVALRTRIGRVSKALDRCVYGYEQDKILIQIMIRSALKAKLSTVEDISRVIDFSSMALDDNIKFEVLLYYLKKLHGKNSMTYLIKKYGIDKVKYDIEKGKTPIYGMTSEELDIAYTAHVPSEIPYADQIAVLAVLIYERWKGYGCIDTLREMNIDGVNIGTSGSILYDTLDSVDYVMKAPRSVWIFFEGKYIHLRYLNMGNEAEVRRIVTLVARSGNPGPLTENRGALVTSMYDKSRVVAIRPQAGEYWAVFIRKFSLGNKSITDLVDPLIYDEKGQPILGPDNQPIHKFKHAELPLRLVEYFMRGQVTTAFTGRQGSGKTTMMSRAIEFIDGTLTLRILEMAPELYLRELYPNRNIFSLQETAHLKAEQEQDILKKCDSLVSIVGEVATNIVAAQMIQFGRVASLFTLFSHHATTAAGLVYALRNSLSAATNTEQAIAESDVLDVVKIDWHLDAMNNGDRYTERVTEIIRLPEGVDYPEYNRKDPINSMNIINREFFRRMTDRKRFITRDILIFNKQTYSYETRNCLSKDLLEDMAKRMPREYVPEFVEFLQDNWEVAA